MQYDADAPTEHTYVDNEEVYPASQVVVDELDRARWTTLSKSHLELDTRFLRFALCARGGRCTYVPLLGLDVPLLGS